MDRRRMLTLTATAAIIPTFPAATSVLAATASMPGEAESKHAEATKMVGSLSLATSRLALTKASDPMVKAFAKWEVAEQETIADILKSMDSGAKAQGALKPPSDSELESMLGDDDKAALGKLKSATGTAFDKAYVSAQLDGHKKLLTIQEDYLKVGQDREHLSVAKLARGQIKEHIDHLDMLKSKA